MNVKSKVEYAYLNYIYKDTVVPLIDLGVDLVISGENSEKILELASYTKNDCNSKITKCYYEVAIECGVIIPIEGEYELWKAYLYRKFDNIDAKLPSINQEDYFYLLLKATLYTIMKKVSQDAFVEVSRYITHLKMFALKNINMEYPDWLNKLYLLSEDVKCSGIHDMYKSVCISLFKLIECISYGAIDNDHSNEILAILTKCEKIDNIQP